MLASIDPFHHIDVYKQGNIIMIRRWMSLLPTMFGFAVKNWVQLSILWEQWCATAPWLWKEDTMTRPSFSLNGVPSKRTSLAHSKYRMLSALFFSTSTFSVLNSFSCWQLTLKIPTSLNPLTTYESVRNTLVLSTVNALGVEPEWIDSAFTVTFVPNAAIATWEAVRIKSLFCTLKTNP